MIDREKVINGLETIKQFFGYGLPSTAEIFDSYYGILNDAIDLLKEQEEWSERDDRYLCPECENSYIHWFMNPETEDGR